MLRSVLSSHFLLLFGLAEAKLKNSPKCSKETLELFCCLDDFSFFVTVLYFGKRATEALQG